MPNPPLIKPTHKAITEYYATLQSLTSQNVSHEMGLRRAFQHLLTTTGKLHDWLLIEEVTNQAPAGNAVRFDATLYKNGMRRGYWEAKDSADSLTKEVSRKTARGYSLVNTIFEDTQTAILYQNGQQVFTAALSDPRQLADLLNQFFAHTEPDFEQLDEAIEDFRDRVPELARGLLAIIESAHKKNPNFKQAFADFFTLCQTSLNPDIAQAAVDEMLVQHILTERLFRTIFNVADFTQRNAIAAEVEKVVGALASQSFSREEYLKGLDRYYRVIEMAARNLEWTEKQHFLNTIYERFFQGYSVKTADTMGIVYTPQPIVDFMCASVVEVLKSEFKKDLGDPDVFVLDPCTGTGNFVVNLLRRIPPKKLPKAYANNLFANEIMLMPYYIAALNIEHTYFELAGNYEAFEGLCFVDTLDLAEVKQHDMFTELNAGRVKRQKRSPITIVIGNPPYNVGQVDENENNKNRRYKVIDSRIRLRYAADSNATLNTKIYDAYVKFFRWATDRLGPNPGIVAFVSNNNFLEGIGFDGLRKHLLQDFSAIYHLDLGGDSRRTEGGNVFGIRVGVGITILVRSPSAEWSNAIGHLFQPAKETHYAEVTPEASPSEKLRELSALRSLERVNWKTIRPDANHNWFPPKSEKAFHRFITIASREARQSDAQQVEVMFREYCLGVSTNRDQAVYNFSESELDKSSKLESSSYAAEVDRYKRANLPEQIDAFVDYSKVKWSSTLKARLKRLQYPKYDADKIRPCMYRPFSKQHLYYDEVLIDRPAAFAEIFPSAKAVDENRVIVTSDIGFRAASPSVLVANAAVDLHLCATTDAHQCFPFYVYAEDGTSRRENITDWSLTQFRTHYKNQKISKWDIFHYVYALLHHPAYRAKFADNLKRELPRIPFAPDFTSFAKAGKKLADLHLNYETTRPHALREIIAERTPRSPRVESKMKLSKDKTQLIVNPSLILAGIPPETFDYKLGNRSALDWIIDQYQLYTDPRTGITSDPNAWGDEHNDPEYIVDLVGRVITVSLETMKIVRAVPQDFAETP